jgi:hypothetical protein
MARYGFTAKFIEADIFDVNVYIIRSKKTKWSLDP